MNVIDFERMRLYYNYNKKVVKPERRDNGIYSNPSLDYIVEVKSFELGMTNRTSYEHMLPGGKGINVSIVLNNLEFDTTAFGFVAGFTGKQICDMVSEYGINTDFIQVDNGFSRIT